MCENGAYNIFPLNTYYEEINNSNNKYNLNYTTYNYFIKKDFIYSIIKIYIYSTNDIKLLMLMDIIDRNKFIYLLEQEDIIILMNNLNKEEKMAILDFFCERRQVNDIYLKYYINCAFKLKHLLKYEIKSAIYINDKTYYSNRFISDILLINNAKYVNTYFKHNINVINKITGLKKPAIKEIISFARSKTNGAEEYLNNEIMIHIILILALNKDTNIYYWFKYSKILLSKRLIMYLYYQFRHINKMNKILYYISNLENNFKLIKYLEMGIGF